MVNILLECSLKNKTINDVFIYHIISKFTEYGNNGTPKVKIRDFHTS